MPPRETIEINKELPEIDNVFLTSVPNVFLLTQPSAPPFLICQSRITPLASPKEYRDATTFHLSAQSLTLRVYIGDLFGTIICYTYGTPIISQPVYKDDLNTPISSICSLDTIAEQIIVVVATFIELIVLDYSNPNKDGFILQKIPRPKDRTACFPAFVATNEQFREVDKDHIPTIAWLNHEELRLFHREDLLAPSNRNHSIKVTDLAVHFNVPIHQILGQFFPPLLLTKNYVIIHSQNVIVGFSFKDFHVCFRYPLVGLLIKSVQIGYPLKIVQIVTQQGFYTIDMEDESPPSPFVNYMNLRRKTIQSLVPTQQVPVSEILFDILKNPPFTDAETLLLSLSSKIPTLGKLFTENPGAIQCLFFLIYEIQLHSRFLSGDDDVISFKAKISETLIF